MEHYVTLFDSLFLPQGMALHMSMERHAGEYTLWILCMDDEVHKVLTKLNLPNVCLLQLSKLETEELKLVKLTRTKGEYCWTLTPFSPRFVFEANPDVQRVTYLDADVWFRKNPEPIFRELDVSNKHVLITDHAYAPEYDQSATSGQYCVQFLTFTRLTGEEVRKWWEKRCVEWCFSRVENGKFGDQKYLDDWPKRFEKSVHVLRYQEWTQAPWNSTRYPYSKCIIYHFHGLRISGARQVDFGSIYRFPAVVIKNIYEPYVIDLVDAINMLHKNGFNIVSQINKLSTAGLLIRYAKNIYRNFRRVNSLNYMKY